MSYNIIAVPSFKIGLKKLTKKYSSLKSEFAALIDSLKINPKQGTALGNNSYKIRLGIKSKGKGKSGGARVITHIVFSESTVFLLAIYDKSEKANLSDKELKALLKQLK